MATPAKRKEDAGKEYAEKLIKKFERLRSLRGNWESHWQEIAERIWPSQSRLFQGGNESSAASQGEKRNQQVFDSTASSALNKFAAVLDSLLTPMDQTWHNIVPTDPYLAKDRETQLWLEELNGNLFRKRYAPNSNFVPQNQLVYKGLGAYGSGCLFVDELKGRRGERGFRYRNVHLSEVYFLENHQGIIDEAIRHFKMQARQIIGKWGDTAPACVKTKMKEDPEYEFFVLHCVSERKNPDYQRADFMGMEWESHYVCIEGKTQLEEGGYDSFPYGIARYEQVPGEVYGRSPAMEALPAIKTLNEMKRTLLTHGHRSVAPPLFAHDDGVVDAFNLRPGAINFGGVNADGKLLVHPMPVGNIVIGKDLMDDERFIINDLFLVPLFQAMQEVGNRATAYEVAERMKEKGILLAPTVGRQHNEYHGRVIDREIDLELKQNPELMKRMPQAFREAGAEFKLRFESPMARMQRSEEVAGYLSVLETNMNFAVQTGNPAPLDHFNLDVITPDIAEIKGLPKKWMNGMDAIQKIRDGRAEQAKTQQAIEAAPAAAGLVSAASKTKAA